jgi:hypothetical protein
MPRWFVGIAAKSRSYSFVFDASELAPGMFTFPSGHFAKGP